MAATLRRSGEASFDGADGVVWSRNSWATPPRLRELMWLRCFLLIAHPPLLPLRRGATTNSGLFSRREDAVEIPAEYFCYCILFDGQFIQSCSLCSVNDASPPGWEE